MKTRISKSEVKARFKTVIDAHYALQDMLSGLVPDYYIAGVYGHYADVYYVAPGVVILQGGNTFGNVHPDARTCEQFNRAACDALHRTSDPAVWAGVRRELIRDFIGTVVK